MVTSQTRSLARSFAGAVTLLTLAASLQTVDGDDGADRTVQAGVDLSAVTDRSELSFEETEAYYALLDSASRTARSSLESKARKLISERRDALPELAAQADDDFPLFYDLTQHPEAYRGQPVTMRGHLVRLVKYEAGPNEHGIDTLYEGWLVTPDSQTHPATVICTEIPEGMPIGEELIDGVSVTGLFFKLHTYPSRDNKVRFAPMVLAHTFEWSPEGVSTTGWPISQSAMIATILLLAIVCGLVVWRVSRQDVRSRSARYDDVVPQQPPDFLNDLTS